MVDSAVRILFDSQAPTVPSYKLVQNQLKLNSRSENQSSKASPALSLSEGTASKDVNFEKSPGDRSLKEEQANRTVFVGNIPACCSKKDVKRLFKGRASIESIRLRSIKVSSGDMPSKLAKRNHHLLEGSTFNAYVVLASPTEVEGCCSLNGTFFHGRHLRFDRVGKNGPRQNNKRSVFIGNLPFSADEEKLRCVFSICGEIESVRIVRDAKSGIGKGFGFVTFKDKSSVMFAVKQNKQVELDGRKLRVSRSKDYSVLQMEKQVRRSGIKSNKSGLDHKSKLLSANSIMGKRRPDGTKNRYYRIQSRTATVT